MMLSMFVTCEEGGDGDDGGNEGGEDSGDDGEDYDEDEGGPGLCCEVVIPPQCGGRDRGAGQDLITRDS